MGLETNQHIQRALDYAAKDNVYNYLIEKMKEPKKIADNENGLGIYKGEIERLRDQGNSYAIAKAAMEQFCSENGMDLDALVDQFKQKHKQMTREELIERNKAVTERQKGKIARSAETQPMPTQEEFEKLAEESVKFNTDFVTEVNKSFDSRKL